MGKAKGRAKFDLFEVAEDGNMVGHVLAWVIMGVLLAWRLIPFFQEIVGAYDPKEIITAIGLVRIANGFASVVIVSGLLMAWHALCHRSAFTRGLLKCNVGGFTPNGIMSGGFLPIPAMLSMSLLMFVTSTFVSEAYVRGDWIDPTSAFGPWVPDMRCRWTSTEDSDWLVHWFGRFDREAAVPAGLIATLTQEGRKAGDEGTCYMGPNPDATTPGDFTAADIAGIGWTTNGVGGNPGEGRIYPVGDDSAAPKQKCMYQCVAWRAFALPTLITNIGSIGVGAAAIVTITNLLSKKSGPTLIDENSGPDMLEKLRSGQANGICSYYPEALKRSSLSACIKLAMIYLVIKGFAAQVNADGMSTVDYFVTFGTIFAGYVVCATRIWHPFYDDRLLYTQKLWLNGKDTFYIHSQDCDGQIRDYLSKQVTRALAADYDDDDSDDDLLLRIFKYLEKYVPVPHQEGMTTKEALKAMGHREISDSMWSIEIDLLQWMHMNRSDRWLLLVDYARRVDTGTKEGASVTMLGSKARCSEVKCHCGHWHALPTGVDVDSRQDKLTFTALAGSKNERGIVKKANGANVEMEAIHIIENSADWDKLLAMGQLADAQKKIHHRAGQGVQEPLLQAPRR